MRRREARAAAPARCRPTASGREARAAARCRRPTFDKKKTSDCWPRGLIPPSATSFDSSASPIHGLASELQKYLYPSGENRCLTERAPACFGCCRTIVWLHISLYKMCGSSIRSAQPCWAARAGYPVGRTSVGAWRRGGQDSRRERLSQRRAMREVMSE